MEIILAVVLLNPQPITLPNKKGQNSPITKNVTVSEITANLINSEIRQTEMTKVKLLFQIM